MSEHPPFEQAPPAAVPPAYAPLPSSTAPQRLRSPLTLKLAGIAWMLAGVVFSLGPVLTAMLLHLQYLAIRRQVFAAAGTAEAVDPTELLNLQQYLEQFEQWERAIQDALGVLLVPLAILYALLAAAMLVVYLVLGWRTMRGANWARITGTVLCALSAPLILTVWLFFLGFEWLPLSALRANSAGIALLALNATGAVLAWLPASNAYVRARRLARVPG